MASYEPIGNVFYDAAAKAQAFNQSRDTATRQEQMRNVFAETMRNRSQYGSDQEAMTAAAGKVGAGGNPDEYLKIMKAVSEMDDSDRKKLKDMSERHGASALYLLDQFDKNMKTMRDPAQAFQPVMQEYSKLYTSLPAQDKKYMTLPEQLTPSALAGMAHEASVTRMLLGQYKAKTEEKKAVTRGGKGATTSFVQIADYLTSRGIKPDGSRYTPAEAQEEAKRMTMQAKSKSREEYVATRMKDVFSTSPAKRQTMAAQYGDEYDFIHGNFADSGGEKQAAANKTGKKAKDKATGVIYYEMSNGSWVDDKGNPYKGK